VNVCGKDVQVDGRLIRTARLVADGYEFFEQPLAALEQVRSVDTRIDLFTFMQRLPETQPKYDFPLEWDNVAALPVSTFDHWWEKQINAKVRNMVRAAEKRGTVVRTVPFDDALVQGISAIYNESPFRRGRHFHHYGKDLESVRRENGTFLERSVFLGAFFGERLIGFAKLVSDETGAQAGLMQILAMIGHRDKAPTNALIAEAVRSCAARGIPYLVYSQFAYGKKQQDSLSDFKTYNGFRKIDLPRYHVPLTALGRLAIRAGLQHPIADRIPESFVAPLRALRGFWYRSERKPSEDPRREHHLAKRESPVSSGERG
jgi:hypothetical protein